MPLSNVPLQVAGNTTRLVRNTFHLTGTPKCKLSMGIEEHILVDYPPLAKLYFLSIKGGLMYIITNST